MAPEIRYRCEVTAELVSRAEPEIHELLRWWTERWHETVRTRRRRIPLAVVVATALLVAGCPSSRAAAERRPRSVVALGDSITEGRYAGAPAVTAPYPATLQRLLGPGWTVDNLGAGGHRAEDVLRRWRKEARGRGYEIAVVLAGANDLRRGAGAEAIFAPLSKIYDEALADGMALVAVTATPFRGWRGDRWTSERQEALEDLNRRIEGYCAARGCAVADAFAALADPEDPRSLGPAYDSGDHLHPSQAGLDRLAEAVRDGIRR